MQGRAGDISVKSMLETSAIQMKPEVRLLFAEICRVGSSPACCRPTSWFGYRTYTDPRSTFVVCLDIWRRSCPTYIVTLETFITKMSVAYLCYKIDPIGDAWHTYLGNTSGYSLGMYAHWRSHYILHHCPNLVHFFWNKNIGEGLV